MATIFEDNEFIYLSKLSFSDVLTYYVLYPNNPKKILKDIEFEENLDFREKIDFIEKQLKKVKFSNEEINKMENYIRKSENIKFNYNYDWLICPYENLKEEFWKNPNKLLIKQKFNFQKDKDIFEDKILAKVIYALYGGNKPGKTKKWYSFPENKIQNILNPEKIINNKKNSERDFKYGYRIMELYGFDKYRDEISETMIIIIDTLDSILKKEFEKNDSLSKEIMDIIIELYEEFIIEKILCEEKPNLEDTKIINVMQYLLFIVSKQYKIIYDKEKNVFLSEIKNEKDDIYQKILNIVEDTKKKIE